MRIEVATPQIDSKKAKGDLLEDLSKELLKAQNYEVESEIRRTGVELDLLCKNKANGNKKIYVECKAYRDNRTIESGIIYKMMGIKEAKKYQEAWLITTCPLGKDAKGVVAGLMEDDKDVTLSFYTPEKLISALVDSKVIIDISVAENEVKKVINNKNLIGEITLLITKHGYFWAFNQKTGGKEVGVILVHASNAKIVDDSELLEEISKTDTTLENLNFHQISVLKDSPLEENKQKIRLNIDYYNKIIDTGVKYTHPNKRNLDIDDLFVYQDLQVLNKEEKISSSKLNSIDSDSIKLFIFGNEVSGKTTLAYKLQRVYVNMGYIPVYINSSLIKSSNVEKIKKLITRNIKKQYENMTTEVANKMQCENIILIIDDYQNIKTNKPSTILFISEINKKFEKIIFFSNSSKELEVVTDAEISDVLEGYKFYKINELGYKLRDEVINKWVSIGKKETIDEDEKHKKIIELASTIDTTVGRNFVPTYPIYVFTLLQSFEATTSKSLQGSAYAEFYNFLITQSLGISGVKASELHLYFNFLSELSYSFFKDSNKDINESSLSDFHQNFCENKLITKTTSYEKTKRILLTSKILKVENSIYSFNHNYIYYFFVAKYMSEKRMNNSIRNEIESITKKLYVTEFANIIIFLVHFSKDDFILDGIIAEAKSLFDDIKITTFDVKEVSNINNLIEKELRIIIEDKPVKESRDEELSIKDDLSIDEKSTDIVSEDAKYDDDIKMLDVFGKINLSFKLIEILGQITKNYYGSLDAPIKISLLEETYNLGLRSLNSLMQDFNEYTHILEEEILDIITKKNITSNQEATLVAKQIVFDFATMLSYVFLSKIANSVASKDLKEACQIVFNKNKNISKKLINTAIDLDFPNGIDANYLIKFNSELKGNNIAKMLLKLFVTRHMYKFNVLFNQKQKICNKLNIGINKQRKMLAHTK